MTTRVSVTGSSAYDVTVGRQLESNAVELLERFDAVAVVRPDALAALAAGYVSALVTAGCRVVEISVPEGEGAKSLSAVASIWDALASAGISRSDALLAVGGGATTDAAGFAAAAWLRGVQVVHVPTSLLGMVDAAVGGKTGINTSAGKNLVGAFHPPLGVLVDLASLDTLPEPEWVNGMAEVVKAGFIADPVILDLVESDIASARSVRGRHAEELIERAIRVKCEVVSEDLRESGLREILNYGHTLGHAIEQAEHYRMPHGHAISVGMVFAAELGHRLTGLDPETAARHAAILSALGLPIQYRGASWAALAAAMRSDKKVRSGVQRFILLDGLARPTVVTDPDPEELNAVFDEVVAA